MLEIFLASHLLARRVDRACDAIFLPFPCRLLNGPTGRSAVNLFEWTMTASGAHNSCCQPHKSVSARDGKDGACWWKTDAKFRTASAK